MVYFLDLVDAFHAVIRRLAVPEMAYDEDDIAHVLSQCPLPEGLRGVAEYMLRQPAKLTHSEVGPHLRAPTRRRTGPRILQSTRLVRTRAFP